MKKLFFYAAAAVAMLAGCQKNEISEIQAIDDNQPAAILFGIDAPALTTAKAATKAAVDAWDSTTVYVYGIKENRDANLAVVPIGQNRYNFDEILINNYSTLANPSRVSSATPVSALEVYADEAKKMPYYYAEGETYDFFGYHLGGATPGAADMTATDVITYPITIAGNNDVMVAHTVRKTDVKKADASHGVLEDDLYSAWAARRGVQPTLKFKHALTRFNFIIKGEANAAGGVNDYSQVTITGIKLADMATTGTLTVVGDTADLGFVADTTAATAVIDTLALQTIIENGVDPHHAGLNLYRDGNYVAEVVTENANNDKAGNGSCLMVAPNLKSVQVVVNMVNNVHNEDLPNYEFEVKAENIKDASGNLLGAGAKFEAGKAYNIIIKVKGPKDIQIEAALTEWEIAGEYEYDSDIRPGGRPQTPNPAAPEYEEVNATKTQLTATATEDEFKEYLPESYWKNDEGEFDQDKYNAAKASFPWIVSVFTQKIPANSIIKVQVKYDGAVVTLDPAKIKWVGSEIAADGQSMTVTKTFDMSCVSFEVEGELGFNATEVDLTKFQILVSVQK